MTRLPLATTALAALALAALPSTSHAGFDGGPDGFELGDFIAATHTPARGSSLVHAVTALAGDEDLCPGVSLDYSVERDFSFSSHTWTWESAALSEATVVDLNWLHEGDHRRFRATAGATLSVEVGGTNEVLHSGRASGAFFRAGDTTVSVAAGQTVVVTITGRTFDRSNNGRIFGSMELRPNTCEDLNADPICDEATPTIDSLWPPNHRWEQVDVDGVTDPDGDAVSIVIDSIFQDEAVDGTGNGNTDPDAAGLGTTTAEVVAERDGGGNGRVYHIGFSAYDGLGGSCAGEVLVDVPQSQGNNGAAVDDGALFDSTNP